MALEGCLEAFGARGFVHTVWNLAAPLSVETAKNPLIARQVTINGMRNVPRQLKKPRMSPF